MGIQQHSPKDFWGMEFKEALWAMDGWDIKSERDMRERWEMSRLGWYYGLMPHMGKKTIKPADLLAFPWEKVLKITEIDKQILNSFPEKWPG